MTRFKRLLIVCAAALVLPGYKCGNVLEDNGFDLWCGDALCAWELETGDAVRAPTWHGRDYGVELVGDQVAISQLVKRDSGSLTCLRFELIADVAPTTSVTIELDFFDDGVVDHVQAVPTSNWALLTYPLTLPDSYQGIRVRLRKQGAGRAVLADIAAIDTDECTGAPIEVDSRPKGAWCDSEHPCDSGICRDGLRSGAPMVCSQCAGDTDCAAGQICGVAQWVPGHLDPYRSCVDPEQLALGRICSRDTECATGVCCDRVCSTCCSTGACDGAACAPRRYQESALEYWMAAPHQCEPGAGAMPAGALCLDGADCASGVCTGGGPLAVCLMDSRACQSDADCPPDLADLVGEDGGCVEVGTEGGVCE
jgi:hypothetical protein